jgi:RNA polymerase sigma factor (sigma-70 family)
MTRSLHTLIQYLRHSIHRSGDAALTDAQLLERWLGQHDPAAFELLLWRHGPMVLNTCRRLLPRREDAEDAFQATFLVFVRKAGSIRRREALAAWLHRVACRIAGRARATENRRASREQPFVDEPTAPHIDAPLVRNLHAALDEEIESLPSHYRRALVLCCLEGKSQEDAARLLDRPRGTVSSWLTRGRERLRQRLLRRGIVVSTAGLTAALTPDALASGGMIALVSSLVRMAGAVALGRVVPAGLMSARTLALAEGVLRMMFMTKVKIVAAVSLAVAVAAAGLGAWSHTTQAAEDRPAPPQSTGTSQLNPEHQRRAVFTDDTVLENDKKEQDGIAWGEKAHGLQAGIAFRRGDQETHEVGQSVTFVVYLRNASDKKIDLSHVETLFEERMPYVADERGLRLVVALGPIPFDRPLVHRSVKPGQRITLGYPWFCIRPLDWNGEVHGPTLCALPGRYKVGYTGLSLRLSDGKDISLGTKQVDLNLREREDAKKSHSVKTDQTPEAVRSLYQRAEAYRAKAQRRLANEEEEIIRGCWTLAAEQFIKLEALLQDEKSASSITDKQREEVPFRIAECYFNLSQYEKALQKYEEIAKRCDNKPSELRALGETIRCFMALRDYKKCRQQVTKIRDRLGISVEMTEEERQQWLKWLDMIDDATIQMELDLRKRETAKEDGANQKAPTVEKPIPVIPAIGKPGKTPLFFVPIRAFEIPFTSTRKQTREVILLVSRDQGRTWEQADKRPSTERAFHFRARRDGTYWFLVQEVDEQGRCKPTDLKGVEPAIRACVDTTPPIAEFQTKCEQKTVDLTWTSEDANLEDMPIQFEWSGQKDGPWIPIVHGLLPNTGHFEWHLPDKMPRELYVRIHVRDKAGNDGYAVTYIKLKTDE